MLSIDPFAILIVAACIVSAALAATTVYYVVRDFKDPQKIWKKDLIDLTSEDMEYLRVRCSVIEFRYIQTQAQVVRQRHEAFPNEGHGQTVHSTILDLYDYHYDLTLTEKD